MSETLLKTILGLIMVVWFGVLMLWGSIRLYLRQVSRRLPSRAGTGVYPSPVPAPMPPIKTQPEEDISSSAVSTIKTQPEMRAMPNTGRLGPLDSPTEMD